MMPAKPTKRVMGNRREQVVYRVLHRAAKAAYLVAAQECLGRAYDAAGGGINLNEIYGFISDESVSLEQLKEMCVPGYQWGGSVKTL